MLNTNYIRVTKKLLPSSQNRVSGPCLGLELNIKKIEIFWPSCNGTKLREGLFHVDIRRLSLGVKLLRRAVSRDADFISGLAMRRAVNSVDWMDHILRDSGICGMNDDYVSVLDCLRGMIPSFDFSHFTNKDTVPSKAQQTLASALFSEMVKNIDDIPSYPARRPPLRLGGLPFELEWDLFLIEGSITGRNTEGNRPSKARAKENRRQEMNLPLLLVAHLGRNENGEPLQSSLTSVHGGRQSSINIRGNLPPNGTLLLHDVQPFMPSSVHVPNGFVPTHVNPYSQPSVGIINGQTLSFPFYKLKLPAKEVHEDAFGSSIIKQREARVSELSPLGIQMIKAREVANNGTPNDRRDKFKRLLSSLSKSPGESLATEKVARSFEQPPRMLGSRRSRDMSRNCYFHKDHRHDTNDFLKLRRQIEEAMKSGQLSPPYKRDQEGKGKNLRQPTGREERKKHYSS
nr:reverse transcriptase domain-containing protein [Tanacetum cinerariifolium]